MMKGLSLAINAVIIIAIASVVLLVISIFFLGSTGPSMNKINARQVFEDKCPKFKCTFDTPITDEEFLDACKTLYNIETNPNLCLAYCNCGLEVDSCKLDCDICDTDEACKNQLKLKRPDCSC